MVGGGTLLAQVPDRVRTVAVNGAVWLAVALAAILGAVLIVRWVRVGESRRGPSTGFTLADLRAMRERGELTVPEYEALRGRMVKGAGAGERKGESA